MSMNLEPYMRSRYVNGGRALPSVDCWGMTRLAFNEIHGIELPPLNGLNAESLMGKSRNYVQLAKIMRECPPQHGAIAAVVTGNACEHVGICITISGNLFVMETTEETGPRIIPLSAFVEERGNVRCYTSA